MGGTEDHPSRAVVAFPPARRTRCKGCPDRNVGLNACASLLPLAFFTRGDVLKAPDPLFLIYPSSSGRIYFRFSMRVSTVLLFSVFDLSSRLDAFHLERLRDFQLFKTDSAF